MRDDLCALEEAIALLDGKTGLEIWQGDRWVAGLYPDGSPIQFPNRMPQKASTEGVNKIRHHVSSFPRRSSSRSPSCS